MNKMTLWAAALAAATGLASPALAQDGEGRWQIKVLGSGVLPDGKIDAVKDACKELKIGPCAPK